MDKGKNAKCKQPRISIEYICKAKHRIEWNNLCLFAGKRIKMMKQNLEEILIL